MRIISLNAPLTLSFTALCLIAFVLSNQNPLWFVLPAQWTPSSWYTIFTCTLGHVGISHLLGNLSFMLLLCPLLEEKYGVQYMALYFVITSAVIAVVNWMFFHQALAGCSGLVFMCILLTASSASFKKGIPLTLVLVSVLFIGKEWLQSQEEDRIAQFAHIAGGVCGIVFGWLKRR